jgi:DUF4097 and DUF4098 domain-containing protein YvlB
MTRTQKIIKYIAMAFASLLAVGIIGGIVSVVSLLTIADEDDVAKELTTYQITSTVTSLDVEVDAGDLTIKQGDTFAVESNLRRLTVREENGRLIIRNKEERLRVDRAAVLTVYLPIQALNQVRITTGAGRLTVDALMAEVLELEFGASEVMFGSLTATRKADIDGGAGKITIGGGKLCDLSLNMGVGQLNLTGELIGDCEMDLGVGETNITLLGNKEDYALDIEKGLGSVSVEGTDATRFGNGSNRIDIDGGVGAIRIDFE